MAIFYLDSSAVVKYFHSEPGSAWVRQIVNARVGDSRVNTIYIGAVSIAEVPAALAILERTKRIGTRGRDTMYRAFLAALESSWRLLQININLLYAAAELTQQYPLKGYDAVQLALARDYDDRLRAQDLALIFVTGDDVLLQAAHAEGLVAENPFDHE
jgi:predicted nucleic acid-binding protein